MTCLVYSDVFLNSIYVQRTMTKMHLRFVYQLTFKISEMKWNNYDSLYVILHWYKISWYHWKATYYYIFPAEVLICLRFSEYVLFDQSINEGPSSFLLFTFICVSILKTLHPQVLTFIISTSAIKIDKLFLISEK